MKGEIGTNMILVLVLAVLAAGLAIAVFTDHSENVRTGLNNTSETTSGQVDNASCERECKRKNPLGGSSYRSCLENNGCG